MVWLGLVTGASPVLGDDLTIERDPGGSVADSQGGLPYALKINAPWEKGGYLVLNLPEHLEFRDGNANLLH